MYGIFLFVSCLTLISANQVPDGRIVGGNLTSIEKHPWQVSIQVFGNHVCGGSLISPNIVLTAAHCITELIVTIYYVVPGVTNLSDANLKVQVKEAISHANYNSDTYDYDIAVLKLENNITFSDRIQSIGFPPNSSYSIPDGTILITSGWGKTEDADSSDTLREVEVQALDWDTCFSRLSSVGTFTERMICAGVPEGGKDTCTGDSGGALELENTLIGIVSWGADCGVARYPGVYTNVSYFRSWIMEHAGV